MCSMRAACNTPPVTVKLEMHCKADNATVFHSIFDVADVYLSHQSEIHVDHTHNAVRQAFKHVCDDPSYLNIPHAVITKTHQLLSMPITSIRQSKDLDFSESNDSLILKPDQFFESPDHTLFVGAFGIKTTSQTLMSNMRGLVAKIGSNNVTLTLSALVLPRTKTTTCVEHYISTALDGQPRVQAVEQLNKLHNRRTHALIFDATEFSNSHRSRRKLVKSLHTTMMRNFVPVPSNCDTQIHTSPFLIVSKTQTNSSFAGQDGITFYTLCF